MDAVEKCRIAVVFAVACSAVLLLLPAGEAATVYCVKGWMCYNGSDSGYIMSYENVSGSTGQARRYMRVAFSVDRPTFNIGDTVGVMVRTDGYYTRDSGWWYIVRNAVLNISISYPNNTPIRTDYYLTTDSTGVYRNATFIFTNDGFPMGRYRVNGSVIGPRNHSGAYGAQVDLSGIAVGNSFATVYFDLGGELNITMASLPDVNKGAIVSINGTVYQPNNQVFNSTFVIGSGLSSYDVNISITLPNRSVYRTNAELPRMTTTNGSYKISYNTTSEPVGKYYVVAFVDYQLGKQADRGKVTMGRTFQEFVVYGSWPSVGLSMAPSAGEAVLLLLSSLILLKGVRKNEQI